MNKIKILPDNLANQIAAGEVVERPASVIKELLENALDAGAKRISVEIELGGRRLMRVEDDGEGMIRDDAILAFERHATSKIKELKDLGEIKTLGFRGEALASIASVAKVELITKTAEETAATRVLIEGGKLKDVREIGRSVGTTISVRDLFFNTPARRKFMRSEATEIFHITSVITHYALANFETAFTLTSNGREKLRLTPAKNLRERAYQIFGATMIESLLPVSGGREYVAEITGFVSAPRERRTTRDAQYFFINGRYVKDKIVTGGLLEGFRSVLPHGVYPVAILFLDIPHSEIDVNVHPAKTEVRFRRSQAVKESVAEAIRNSLQSAGIIENKEVAQTENLFSNKSDRTNYSAKSDVENDQINKKEFEQNRQNEINFAVAEEKNTEPEKTNELNLPKEKSDNLFVREQEFEIQISSGEFENAAQNRELKDGFKGENFSNSELIRSKSIEKSDESNESDNFGELKNSSNENVLPPFDSAEKIPQAVGVENLRAGKIRPIGQLHESFIIAVDSEGMLLIDQHVAHERILFDKYKRKERERKIESQNLLLPETIDLTPAQAVVFDSIREDLENCGFGTMRLSGRTIAIKSVPTDLPPSEVRNLFAEILETIESDKRGNAKDMIRDNIAASLACKAAVKINMKLTDEKMRWMIDNLLKTSSPTTCPHGRPVILRLSMKDIERRFHRT